MTGSFRLRIVVIWVIGGHFGGGDHFDGGDHFGGGTAPPSTTVDFLHYLRFEPLSGYLTISPLLF